MDILCYAENMQKGYNPERQSKGFAVVYILIGTIVIAGAIVGGAYLVKQTTNFKPKAINLVAQPTPATKPQTSITIVPTGLLPKVTKNNEDLTPEKAKQIISLDETANWKTYTSEKFSYKYPANYFVKESVKGMIVIVANEDTPIQNAEISIDIRLINFYDNFDKAVNHTKEGLTDPKIEEINNGVKISGKVGSGFGQGSQETVALLRYKQGAVSVETTTADLDKLKIFDQILSTFKFLDQKAASKDCKPTGCSGQICSDENVTTTCEFLAQYDCYTTARCERQTDGRCGWTSTEELNKCLSKFQSK